MTEPEGAVVEDKTAGVMVLADEDGDKDADAEGGCDG